MDGVTIHARTGGGILTASLSIDTELVKLTHGVEAIEFACDEMKRHLLEQFREAHPKQVGCSPSLITKVLNGSLKNADAR